MSRVSAKRSCRAATSGPSPSTAADRDCCTPTGPTVGRPWVDRAAELVPVAAGEPFVLATRVVPDDHEAAVAPVRASGGRKTASSWTGQHLHPRHDGVGGIGEPLRSGRRVAVRVTDPDKSTLPSCRSGGSPTRLSTRVTRRRDPAAERSRQRRRGHCRPNDPRLALHVEGRAKDLLAAQSFQQQVRHVGPSLTRLDQSTPGSRQDERSPFGRWSTSGSNQLSWPMIS